MWYYNDVFYQKILSHIKNVPVIDFEEVSDNRSDQVFYFGKLKAEISWFLQINLEKPNKKSLDLLKLKCYY